MIFGPRRGLQHDSDQIPKLIALSGQVGAGVYFWKGLNRYSNVHIDDLVDLYLLVMEKPPGECFFFAENGNNSLKEVAEMIEPPSASAAVRSACPWKMSASNTAKPVVCGWRPTAWLAPPMRGNSASRRRHLLLPITSKVSGGPTSAGGCFRGGG